MPFVDQVKQSAVVPVPEEVNVGQLIGKGGVNFKSISRETGGTKLEYEKEGRCVRIRAPYGFSYADVDSAESKIKALIGGLLSSSQRTMGSSMYEPQAVHRNARAVPVPSEMNIGKLIGTGGSNMKHIEETVGDGLRVRYEQEKNHILVRGNTKQSLQQGVEMVTELLSKCSISPGQLLLKKHSHVFTIPGPPTVVWFAICDKAYKNMDRNKASIEVSQVDPLELAVGADSEEHAALVKRECTILFTYEIETFKQIQDPELVKAISFLTCLSPDQQVHFQMNPELYDFQPHIECGQFYSLLCKGSPEPQANIDAALDITKIRNYAYLRDCLQKALEQCFATDKPQKIKLEIRFGKVLWESHKSRSVSDKVLEGHHRIRDLEKDGQVSLEDFLQTNKHSFCPYFDDRFLKPSELPCLGKETVFSLDVVSLAHGEIETPVHFIIRCSKDGDTNDYKVLEIFRKQIKLIRYDCICLESTMDMRVGLSQSLSDNLNVPPQLNLLAEEIVRTMKEREYDDLFYFISETDKEIKMAVRGEHYGVCYIRRLERTMYGLEYEDHTYILSHTETVQYIDAKQDIVPECGQLVEIDFEDPHEEMELMDPQLMVDFATLEEEKVPVAEVLRRKSIMHFPASHDLVPKKPTVEGILKEFDHFMKCAVSITSAAVPTS